MQILNRFLIRHEKRAYSFAKLSLNHREDALDAVQEAMLAMAKSYAEKPESEWEKLFYSCLFSKIKDVGRRRSRNALFSWLSFDDEQHGHAVDNPEQALFNNQRLNQLAQAMANLSFKQQRIFLLKDVQGYSEKEVAELTNSSVATVKTLSARARNKLRTMDKSSEMLGDNHEY